MYQLMSHTEFISEVGHALRKQLFLEPSRVEKHRVLYPQEFRYLSVSV